MTVFADGMKMIDVSSKLNVEIMRLKQYMDSLETQMVSIGDSWHGKAEKAYFAKMILLRKEYDELVKILSDFSQILHDSGECYSDIDSALAGRIELI